METIILEILRTHDPIGIADDDRPDEYTSEASRIASAFFPSMDLPTLTKTIHGIFVEMFDGVIAGSEDRYKLIAEEIMRRGLFQSE
ncbi:hypothetical protein HY734_01715 [Candidatus Uhrbacteria bacterium]|nr:hypothetical protein [Candidatus Uhrbacteria bacterium]